VPDENLATAPAIGIPLPELADLLNQGFGDYIVKIPWTPELILHLIRVDGVSLSASKILLRNDQKVGIALIARRRQESRLAAMALVPEARGQGRGSYLINQILQDAKQRNELRMHLEAIEQNHRAVALYHRLGFQDKMHLLGFVAENPPGHPNPDLKEIRVRQVVSQALADPRLELPWQISPEAILQLAGPERAFQLGPASAVLVEAQGTVVIRFLFVPPEHRREGHATRLMQAIFAHHPGKNWKIPALWPDCCGPLFTRVGMQKDELSSVWMTQEL
jgi:GNAT superfamily N-acetyltransferase